MMLLFLVDNNIGYFRPICQYWLESTFIFVIYLSTLTVQYIFNLLKNIVNKSKI